MRIAVLGGTGMIGSRIVAEGSVRGHEVLSVSRSGQDPQLMGVSTMAGDATDPRVVESAARGCDAIVCATVPDRSPGGDRSLFMTTISALVDSAGTASVLVVGGAGSLLMPDGTRLTDRPTAPPEWAQEAAVQAQALAYLQTHGAEIRWTYLSPPSMIRPGPRTGTYVRGLDHPVGVEISAEDYAAAVLDELEAPAHIGRRFTVAN
jgi:putative NADH-flavin reductase